MSGDVPIQIIVAAFQDEGAADQALEQLRDAQRQGLIKIDDAAVMRRDVAGKLHIKETADMGGGKGAVVGGVTGAVLGLLAGPIGWGVGLGALVGGLAAKLRDAGFPEERLKQVGEGLKPGTSAIVAVVEHTWVAQVEQELQKQGADVITESLRQDIATQLEAGRDVAYSALSAAGVLEVERVASGADHAEVDRIIATDEGVYVEGATADQGRVVAAAGVFTDQGAVIVGGELTPEGEAGASGDAPAPESAPAGEQRPATPTPGQAPTTS